MPLVEIDDSHEVRHGLAASVGQDRLFTRENVEHMNEHRLSQLASQDQGLRICHLISSAAILKSSNGFGGRQSASGVRCNVDREAQRHRYDRPATLKNCPSLDHGGSGQTKRDTKQSLRRWPYACLPVVLTPVTVLCCWFHNPYCCSMEGPPMPRRDIMGHVQHNLIYVLCIVLRRRVCHHLDAHPLSIVYARAVAQLDLRPAT